MSVVNERLRSGLASAEIPQAVLAERCGVDPKSVERWITQDRMPHAGTRAKVARILGMDETYFWPALLRAERAKNATEAELVQIWPTREAVPPDTWRSFLNQTRSQLDVLVYAGGFLIEAYGLVNVARVKAEAGAHVRLLIGDSRCEAVRQRGREEGLPALAERCRSTAEYLADVAQLPGVDVRTHDTVLYSSQYRFDDSMLVNNHAYGSRAAYSPVMHLKKVPGGHLFAHHDDAFERVWSTGRPLA